MQTTEIIRCTEATYQEFAIKVFTHLGVPAETASLAVRSLLDASLLGVDTHGVESLKMYVDHLVEGGLKATEKPMMMRGVGNLEQWDMRSGFGLASARIIMEHAVSQARLNGIHMATVRRSNHIGACGIYGKIAADAGLIGMVSQQTGPAFAPWGGEEAKIGASPFAFVAPVEGMFPFYFDCSMAAVTRSQIRSYRSLGNPLPEGIAMDARGRPTTDPEEAWFGQLRPIGRYKGVGFAMVFEVLSAIASGNQFANGIPSIVDEPDKSADSGVFLIAINPEAVFPDGRFAERMREYIEYVESSAAKDPNDPPHYPGRREGERWEDRRTNGIPISELGWKNFDLIADRL